LIHFIREHDQRLLRRELKDFADFLGCETAAGRVTRVDYDDGADVGAVFAGGGEAGFDAGEICSPGLGFVEVVRHAAGVEEGEGGGVERVLRDWDEDAGGGGGADDVHEGVDAGGGAGG